MKKIDDILKEYVGQYVKIFYCSNTSEFEVEGTLNNINEDHLVIDCNPVTRLYLNLNIIGIVGFEIYRK